MSQKEIFRIVLTGGPCAGKSTAMPIIKKELEKVKYKVFIVPETATQFMLSGILPDENDNFQDLIFKEQLRKENFYDELANNSKFDKIVIIYDRGIFDSKAYTDNFNYFLSRYNCEELYLRERYNGVIHLVSSAIGAEEYYNFNNEVRIENVLEAEQNDEKIKMAWLGHSHLRVIDNSTNFNEKIKRVIKEIYQIIGEPEPLEIERKFLVECNEFIPVPFYKSKIDQYYFKDKNSRIRRRGIDGKYIYTHCIKTEINELTRLENERKITEDEFNRLIKDCETYISKIRQVFIYNNQYFELDIFEDKKILEIELSGEDQQVQLPPFVRVIKEVTKDKKYKNSNMSIKI